MLHARNVPVSAIISPPKLPQPPPLGLDIKARSTATATRCRWIPDYLELASYQLHRKVNAATLQQFQARLIHHHTCA